MKKEKKARSKIRDWGGLLLALIAALAIRSCAYEPYNIPSSSMVPTLLVGDYLFISKYAYGYSRYSFPFSIPFVPAGKRAFVSGRPERGDIVVFKEPTHNRVDYIKRIIGLPGDTIQMMGGRLYINGQRVEREFVGSVHVETEAGVVQYNRYIETLPNGVKHDIYEVNDNIVSDFTAPVTLPADHYFMMGDNRDNSSDSRFFGPVSFENIEGRAEVIFYSNKSGFLQFWHWKDGMRWDRFFKGIH